MSDNKSFINAVVRNESAAEVMGFIVGAAYLVIVVTIATFVAGKTLGYIGDGIRNMFTQEVPSHFVNEWINRSDIDYVTVTNTDIIIRKDDDGKDFTLDKTTIQFVGYPISVKNNDITQVITTSTNQMFRVYKGLQFNDKTKLYYIRNHEWTSQYGNRICSMSDKKCIPIYPYLDVN